MMFIFEKIFFQLSVDQGFFLIFLFLKSDKLGFFKFIFFKGQTSMFRNIFYRTIKEEFLKNYF